MKYSLVLLILFSISLTANEHRRILSDPKNIVSDSFNIPKKLKDRVHFWFDIYTIHDSKTAVIHDSEDLRVVYMALDTNEIGDSELNSSTKYSLIKRYRKEYYNYYKKALEKLAKGKCQSHYCKKVLKIYRKNKIKIPKRKSTRRSFFKKKIENLRVQTGQKDKIFNGILNIQRHNPTLNKIFEMHNVPKELLAIALLESSFNTKAKSKVNATGPWQFMKGVGKHFMVINRNIDQRKSAFISTTAALHLLKQNKKILKRWDLAINAYNSGTGNILKGIRRLRKRGIRNPGVVDLIEKYNSNVYKFAGKNFYSEFLALAYIYDYRDVVYKGVDFKGSDKTLEPYLTKCRVNLKSTIKNLKSSRFNLKKMNSHLARKTSRFPKGTLIFSDVKLTSRKFHKVTFKQLANYYPKKLYKVVRNYKCSSK